MHTTKLAGSAGVNRRAHCLSETCEETGERLFRAGEYVAPGEYVEIETRRQIPLVSPGFLPARLDGKAARYRTARPGLRVPQTMRESTLAERQARFQTLVAPTHQRLYRFARRALGNSQDAEDVTQETLTRAWNHFATFNGDRSFNAWVFWIARNLLIDQARRRKRRQEISLDAPTPGLDESESVCYPQLADSTSDPQAHLLSKEISGELQAALHSLPTIYRTTLLLVAQQHTYEQIACTMHCSLGTVRSRVHRARARLRRECERSTFHE